MISYFREGNGVAGKIKEKGENQHGWLGRVFSVSQVQHIGQFGVDECMEAFASTSGRFEAALEAGGVALGLWVFLSASIDSGIGQADHHAANGPEHARRFGSANSALILAQTDV